MVNLSDIKQCIGYDTNIEKKETDKMIDRFILDLPCERDENKDGIIIKMAEESFSLNKLYLFQKILINYAIGEGYKKVKFIINYVNLDTIVEKEFDSIIGYPEDRLMAGEYCKECVKNKECKELYNTYMLDIVYPDIKSNDQLYSTLGLMQSKKESFKLIEDELKEILYKKIKENGGALPLYSFGIKLEERNIDKDTISYSEALKLELCNDKTVTMKVGEIKKIKGKIVPFVKVPWKKELMVTNIPKSE